MADDPKNKNIDKALTVERASLTNSQGIAGPMYSKQRASSPRKLRDSSPRQQTQKPVFSRPVHKFGTVGRAGGGVRGQNVELSNSRHGSPLPSRYQKMHESAMSDFDKIEEETKGLDGDEKELSKRAIRVYWQNDPFVDFLIPEQPKFAKRVAEADVGVAFLRNLKTTLGLDLNADVFLQEVESGIVVNMTQPWALLSTRYRLKAAVLTNIFCPINQKTVTKVSQEEKHRFNFLTKEGRSSVSYSIGFIHAKYWKNPEGQFLVLTIDGRWASAKPLTGTCFLQVDRDFEGSKTQIQIADYSPSLEEHTSTITNSYGKSLSGGMGISGSSLSGVSTGAEMTAEISKNEQVSKILPHYKTDVHAFQTSPPLILWKTFYVSNKYNLPAVSSVRKPYEVTFLLAKKKEYHSRFFVSIGYADSEDGSDLKKSSREPEARMFASYFTFEVKINPDQDVIYLGDFEVLTTKQTGTKKDNAPGDFMHEQKLHDMYTSEVALL